MGPLQVGCETGAVQAGCARLGTLDRLTEQLMAMHSRQMSSIGLAAATLGQLLQAPEAAPRANIRIYEPDTTGWEDPQGTYPSLMTVRLDYDRGLKRMGEDMVAQFLSAVDRLHKTVTDAENEWKTLIVATKIKIPSEVQRQRRMATVKVILQEGTRTIQVPETFAEQYITRDAPSWIALASHVITSKGLKHRLVKQHVLTLTPAIQVTSRLRRGDSTYVITEGRASRQKKDLVSMVKARDFCKDLRAELRFTPAGSWPSMRASFPNSEASEGGAQ